MVFKKKGGAVIVDEYGNIISGKLPSRKGGIMSMAKIGSGKKKSYGRKKGRGDAPSSPPRTPPRTPPAYVPPQTVTPMQPPIQIVENPFIPLPSPRGVADWGLRDSRAAFMDYMRELIDNPNLIPSPPPSPPSPPSPPQQSSSSSSSSSSRNVRPRTGSGRKKKGCGSDWEEIPILPIIKEDFPGEMSSMQSHHLSNLMEKPFFARNKRAKELEDLRNKLDILVNRPERYISQGDRHEKDLFINQIRNRLRTIEAEIRGERHEAYERYDMGKEDKKGKGNILGRKKKVAPEIPLAPIIVIPPCAEELGARINRYNDELYRPYPPSIQSAAYQKHHQQAIRVQNKVREYLNKQKKREEKERELMGREDYPI